MSYIKPFKEMKGVIVLEKASFLIKLNMSISLRNSIVIGDFRFRELTDIVSEIHEQRKSLKTKFTIVDSSLNNK